jgi:SAM-dependent methyltransferase
MFPLLDPAACPICGQADPRALHVMRNMRQIVADVFLGVVGCRRCGLVYVTPRPSEEALRGFYDPDHDDGWGRGKDVDTPQGVRKLERKFDAKRAEARLALEVVSRLLPPRAGVAFDYGCGGGAFLDVLQEQGWQTIGLEPHRLAGFAARRHRMVDEIPLTPSADLVIANHVFEHVGDPLSVMRQLAAATREGGRLLCSVPDLEGLARHQDLHYVLNAVHINGFTGVSLRHLCEMAGWEVLHVTHGGFVTEFTHKTRARLGLVARRTAIVVRWEPEPLAPVLAALRAYESPADVSV